MRPLLFPIVLAVLACTHSGVAEAYRAVAQSGGYTLELIDEHGAKLKTYTHRGQSYALGHQGKRYMIRVKNRTRGRIEVVTSVDGRDVLDGQPSDWNKRGYLVNPYGEVVIDGFRLSQSSVAAFRFSSVANSYASQMGNSRDVGVIGVAVFTERPEVPLPTPLPPPRAERSSDEVRGQTGGLGSAPTPAAEASSAPEAQASKRSANSRPGLGTQFGEEHTSHTYTVEFQRASHHPSALLGLRYNDRAGLLALGIDVDEYRRAQLDERRQRESANPFRSNGGFAQPPPGWQR